MGVCSGVGMVLDYQCVMFDAAHLGILKAGKCALRFVIRCKSTAIFSDCTAASKIFVDSTPKCNSQGPRALAVDGLRDQGER